MTSETKENTWISYGSSDDYIIRVKRDLASITFVESQIDYIKMWLKHMKIKIKSEKENVL